MRHLVNIKMSINKFGILLGKSGAYLNYTINGTDYSKITCAITLFARSPSTLMQGRARFDM